MAEMLIQSESLTSIADKIRVLSGTSGAMGLDAMATHVNTANNNVSTEADLIAQIQTALEGKAAGGAEPTLQDKTVTPSTSSQTVKPDSGYDGLSQVTVNAMPIATQATPSVSIDSAGKITATATQTAGYVSAGTKTGTKQLTTQVAKTVTPSKSSQTAVAKNVYTTGAVTVAAIPSKYVDNSTVTAVESDVMSGKKYGAAGVVKTGTFSLDTELSTQESLISQIATALQGKAAGGGSGTSDLELVSVYSDSGAGNTVVCIQTLEETGLSYDLYNAVDADNVIKGSIGVLILYDGDTFSPEYSYGITVIYSNENIYVFVINDNAYISVDMDWG